MNSPNWRLRKGTRKRREKFLSQCPAIACFRRQVSRDNAFGAMEESYVAEAVEAFIKRWQGQKGGP
ncbi:hypothetical protein RGR602_CH01125 [Rhizobium gallicum bv. gallicum R602sp]|uniref:Uncharacterized protein n=1 Tax=Rhizobium gallicum bv. gallicum R602sp TaxID=1041138 RepID=A0A0B4X1T1_9HYPH|nr:hypothetical protein RGR602_CH01125 [Rhizobium gallicum bv. gallicum R602sp]